jgi:hypothetical protein
MKKPFVIGIVVLMIAMLAVPTAQAAPRQDFYAEKICPSVDNPNACDIQSATPPFAQLNGGQIVYTDRVYWENPAGHLFEIAKVEITTGDGSGSAAGQVRWIGNYGLLTIMQGTGSLAGLHANAKIEFKDVAGDGRWVYTWVGTYHVDPSEK